MHARDLTQVPYKELLVASKRQGSLMCNKNKARAAFSRALNTVRRTTSSMDALIKLTKRPDVSAAILRCAVTLGNDFVGTFLAHAMPFARACYRKHQASVQAMLKSVQQTTRQLNALCAHGKQARAACLADALTS